MNRQQQVIQAFHECISQYGYKKTSMEDIAERAGLSRSALYHYYRNKQEIFVALAEAFHQQMLIATQLVLTEAESESEIDCEEFLLRLLECRMVLLYETIVVSNHGHEIADANSHLVDGVSNKALEEYAELVAKGIERMIETQQICLKKVDLSSRYAADFLIASAEGLMHDRGVSNLEQYRAKLQTLVKTVSIAWQGEK